MVGRDLKEVEEAERQGSLRSAHQILQGSEGRGTGWSRQGTEGAEEPGRVGQAEEHADQS